IANGPSADRLCDALKYRHANWINFTVKFCDEHGATYEVKIDQLRHEDSSGTSFVFAGIVIKITGNILPFPGKYVWCLFRAGTPRGGYMYLGEAPIPIAGPHSLSAPWDQRSST
ncbi:MAG TPA: hypothetical protein VMR98_04640, partial [Candidatus Polarisedimenticolaceae bacterium]|nr:hypothetical protein [Candidatus Polarisedimenticolaceae bacterium]